MLHFPVTCPFLLIISVTDGPSVSSAARNVAGEGKLDKDMWLEKEDGHFFLLIFLHVRTQ